MMLFVFVEGSTEEKFVREILNHHLFPLGIYCDPIQVSSSKKKKTRGGVTKYSNVRWDINRVIRTYKSHDDVRYTTMIDLFHLDRLSDTFPEFDRSMAYADKYERVSFLEEEFRKDIDHPRNLFIPYIQLHEFEALLFSNPPCFNAQFSEPDKRNEIDTILTEFGNPELINDDDAPSYRIKRLFPTYEKVRHGVLIANNIGITKMRKKCPHFNEWITKLENLNK